jgi:hypothetical protein
MHTNFKAMDASQACCHVQSRAAGCIWSTESERLESQDKSVCMCVDSLMGFLKILVKTIIMKKSGKIKNY